MMQNSGVKKFFENHWEQMVLWTILIGLFYLFRPFFLLIFETFLFTYITKSLVDWIVKRLNVNYQLTTAVVFILFVGLLGTLITRVGPQVIVESNQILVNIVGENEVETREKVNRFVEKIIVKVAGREKAEAFIASAEYTALMNATKAQAAEAARAALPRVVQGLFHLVKAGWQIVISTFLAIIFAFFLVLDWRRIAEKMRALETSRIRTFYLGAAPHLQAFADVLGKTLRAQAIIAACNTVLTVIGLLFFGVPNVSLLAVVVFFCGFIPILGTFISSVPILLFGIETGGLPLAVKLLGLILVVHGFEVYILNPRITANLLHIHPLLVLVLILVGERFFGIWGMVVGVPIGYYLISMLTKPDETLADEPQPPAGTG